MLSGEEIEVVGEAADGVAGVELIARVDPDVALMDLRMPGGGGVEAIREIGRRKLRCRVLVLTTYGADSDTIPADRGRGYRVSAEGRTEGSARRRNQGSRDRAARCCRLPIAAKLMSRVREPAGEPLSSREREVLGLSARGTSNREIAESLFISEATVKTHLVHVYEKLGVRDRAAAVATAYEQGLLGGR